MIRQNPKIFLGLSDITVLLNAIHHQTGLVTFHGSDILWGFGNDLADYERGEFIRLSVGGEVLLDADTQSLTLLDRCVS